MEPNTYISDPAILLLSLGKSHFNQPLAIGVSHMSYINSSAVVSSSAVSSSVSRETLALRTYTIPAGNVSLAQEKLAAIQSRAQKLGFSVWSVIVSPAYEGKYFVNGERDGEKYSYEETGLVCDVSIQGVESVSIGGWTLIAMLDHRNEHGNIVNRVGEHTHVIPESYRHGCVCDHCQITRQRNMTYVLVKDSSTKRVGSTCLESFTGFSPDEMLARLSDIQRIDADMSELEFGCSGRGERLWGIENFMARTCAIIAQHGYVSKSKAMDEFSGLNPTVLLVMSGEFRCEIKPADVELAKKVIEWASSVDTTGNDYLWNIHCIAKSRHVTERTSGYATSMVSAYKRATEIAENTSVHVGIVGERSVFTALTLNRIIPIESFQYGTSYLLCFTDANGNKVTWKASNMPHNPVTNSRLRDGEIVNMFGTVKEHSEYKGVKQTALSRCEVLTEDKLCTLLAKSAKKSRKK